MGITEDSTLICENCEKYRKKSCKNLDIIKPVFFNIQRNTNLLFRINMIRCNDMKIKGKTSSSLVNLRTDETIETVVEDDF